MPKTSDPDEIAATLPKDLQNVRALPGIVAKSGDRDHIRLHRLKNITEHLTIRNEDILHRAQVQGVVEHSILWVKKDAVMSHTNDIAPDCDSDARILVGKLVDQCFAGSGESGLPTGGSDFLAAAGSSGENSATTLDCWHCCSVALSGC